MSIRHMVICFHQAMGQPILDTPQVPPDARVRFRWKLMLEEMREAFEATFDFTTGPGAVGQHDRRVLDVAFGMLERMAQYQDIKVDLVAFADGLADLDYVVEGTRLEFGIDGEPILQEVHRANMAKLAIKDGKATKPEGWTPPDIRGCLQAQRPPEVKLQQWAEPPTLMQQGKMNRCLGWDQCGEYTVSVTGWCPACWRLLGILPDTEPAPEPVAGSCRYCGAPPGVDHFLSCNGSDSDPDFPEYGTGGGDQW